MITKDLIEDLRYHVKKATIDKIIEEDEEAESDFIRPNN